MRFNLLHWKGLLFNWTHSVKRGINFKMSNTLCRVSFAVLCSRIGTQLTSKRPPGAQGWPYLDIKCLSPYFISVHLFDLFISTPSSRRGTISFLQFSLTTKGRTCRESMFSYRTT